MKEETCPLAIVENRRKEKILKKLLTQLELEEKYPGYYDVAQDINDFLEGEREDEY